MLDATPQPALVAQPAPRVSVARLVIARSVDEVAAILPRLFNLCRSAQSAAVEAALGRPVDEAGIAQEILRDHLVKFHITWPAFFGCPPCPLPEGWADGGSALRQAVFGPSGAPPATAADFFAFLNGGAGCAGILKKIDGCFAAGEAVADGLDLVTPERMWSSAAIENSVAARVAHVPAMKGIEQDCGRGPLWRAAARLYDLEHVLSGALPPVLSPAPGEAVVPAARGSYGVRIATRGTQVAAFDRVTPTDHLLAEDGVLDRALASLPAHKAALGPLLLDILDPCSPVRLREAKHA
ncbi:MAG: hydrogenase expression/formation protein HupK [Pseudomonadota bacterium]